MPVATLVSLEEHLKAVYEPDCEYLDGELVERNMGESDHAGVQGIVLAWLRQRRKQLGIRAFPEMRMQVTPGRFRVPDIVVTTSQIKGHILREPPFLCIEVLSPEDRTSRTEPKLMDT